MEKYMLPCPIKHYFGFDCLGCGMQRSFVLLFCGEFKEAFLLYPAIYPMVLFGLFLVFYKFYPSKNARKIGFVLGTISIISIVSGYAFKHFF